jgi:hypothetical protein
VVRRCYASRGTDRWLEQLAPRVPRPGVQADSCQIGSRAVWIDESGMGQVDPSALHVERAEDNAEETEATQVAEATWWERGGRPAGGGVVLGRERET